MARPKGLRLHKPALDLYRDANALSLTETAAIFGLTLPTLSNLATGVSGASEKTVDQIEGRIGRTATEAIFPERTGRFCPMPDPVKDEAA